MAPPVPPPPAQPLPFVPTAPVERDEPAPSASPSAGAKLLRGWHLGAFAENAWGVAPGATGGLALRGGVDALRGSLDLEAHYEAPVGESAPQGGAVRSWLLAASVVPCWRLGIFALCGLATLGRLQASLSGVTSPESKDAFFASLGGRVGVELPVMPLLAFTVHADLAGNLTRATFQLDGTPAWRAPALQGGFAAGALVRFR